MLPNGNYSYADLKSVVQRTASANGHSRTGITITFIPSRLLVYATLEANYQLDFRTGNFGNLLGFNKEVVTACKYGDKLPNITNSVYDVVVHTSIISESIASGLSSDALYRFTVDSLPLSYPFHKERKRLLWCKINSSVIKKL